MECFVIVLDKLFEKLQSDQGSMARLALLINILMDNSKLQIHGEALRLLFGVAFRVYLKRYKKGDSSEIQAKNFAPVENFILLVMSRCETNSQTEINAAMRKGLAYSASRKDIFTHHAPSNSYGQTLMEITQSAIPQPISQSSSHTQFKNMKRTNSVAKISYASNLVGQSGLTAIQENSAQTDRQNRPSMSEYQDQLDEYMAKNIIFLTDQAEMNIQRVERLRAAFRKGPESQDLEVQARKCVPLFLVPQTNQIASSPLYSRAIPVDVSNEKGIKSGIFGWCFVCRESAEYYSKEYKLPVCSQGCKDKLANDLLIIDKIHYKSEFMATLGSTRPTLNSEIVAHQYGNQESRADNIYRLDALAILNYVFDLVEIEREFPQKKDIVLAALTDCTLLLLEKAGISLSSSQRFKGTLQKRILQILAPLILLSTPRVAETACRVVLVLAKRFRSFLKVQLYCLLEKVILSAFESQLLSEEHRHSMFSMVTSLISHKDLVTDLYVNFDCSAGFSNLLDHLIKLVRKLD